jgi:DNA polymerase I-like protein with 3'-5' exonuclease and polymerase domains
MYVADPGFVLVEFDYNQLEARILGAVSGDTELQRAIAEGLHDTNLRLLGVDKTRAKNAFYGWSYMAGAPTLVKTFHQHGFDVSHRECQAMLNTFNKKFHVARAFQERRAALAEEQFYVENAFGLRRYFQKRGCGPAAANHEMQSDGAIIIWRVLPQIERCVESYGGALLATIHDSVLVQLPIRVPKTDTPWHAIVDILEQEWPEIKPRFRVPVSVKTGTDWGTMKEIEQ